MRKTKKKKKKKNKRPVINASRLVSGYKRQWIRCPECKKIYYMDYIPYSIGNPIRWLPCNHDFGHRFSDFIERITEEDVLRTHDIKIKGGN